MLKLKHVFGFKNENRQAKVYFDSKTGEWSVHYFMLNQRVKPAYCFANDEQNAVDKAQYWVNHSR